MSSKATLRSRRMRIVRRPESAVIRRSFVIFYQGICSTMKGTETRLNLIKWVSQRGKYCPETGQFFSQGFWIEKEMDRKLLKSLGSAPDFLSMWVITAVFER